MNTKSIVTKYVEKYKLVKKRLAHEQEALTVAITKHDDTLAAQNIIQTVAQKVQQTAHKQIAAVVSRCLRAVFQERAYKFRINFERKRGQTEAKLLFVKKDLELDPIEGCGGGVIDVAAFALRLACLLLQKPRKRKVLILDEAFRFLSERREYRDRVRDLLERLSEEMNVQFIMITHSKELEIGKVIEV